MFHDLEHPRLAGAGRAIDGYAFRPESQEQIRALLFTKNRHRGPHEVAVLAAPDSRVGRPAGGAHAAEQRLKGIPTRLVERRERRAPDDRVDLLIEQVAGRRIGLDDLVGQRIKNEDRLIRDLEQQAVAGARKADAGEFPVHPLLGRQQLLLQIRHRPEAAADRDNAPLGTEACGREQDRHRVWRGRQVINVAPPAGPVIGGIAQELDDLGAAFRGDDFKPRLADPIAANLVGDVGAAERNITDDEGLARGNDEGNIGSRRQYFCRGGCIQIAEPLFRRRKRFHRWIRRVSYIMSVTNYVWIRLLTGVRRRLPPTI